MSEMVNRVARALAISDGYDPDDTTDVGFEVHGIPVRVAYERLARAAIEAMREPTEEMKNIDPAYYGSCPTCGGVEQAWPAMIDAALGKINA